MSGQEGSQSLPVPVTPQAVAHREDAAATVGALLHLAIEKNLGVEGLEKLVALHERVANRAAAEEFADALARFQSRCPPIQKTATATIVTNKGNPFTYTFAALDEISRTVRPFLHDEGFSYGWDSEPAGDGFVKVVCTLRHRNGHKETATAIFPIISSAGMTEQQKYRSARSYGRRETLTAVLGLSTADPDTDGNEPDAKVSADQIARLEDAFDGVHMSKPRFFRLLAVKTERLEDIPAALFETAMNLLTEKKRAQERGPVE